MESRPYCSWEGISECGEPRGVRRVQKGLEWPWVGAEPALLALVGPWQYQCSPAGAWEGTGRVLYRVLPPSQDPVYPSPAPRTRTSPRYTTRRRYALTGGFGSTKEILGVDNALLGPVSLDCHTPHLTPAPPVSLPGSLGGL